MTTRVVRYLYLLVNHSLNTINECPGKRRFDFPILQAKRSVNREKDPSVRPKMLHKKCNEQGCLVELVSKAIIQI